MNPFNLTESGVPAGTREVLAVQIATAEAAARLQVKEASSPLFERFARTNTAPALRRAILPALNALHAPQLSEAVRMALADADPSLRAAALPFLNRLEGGDAVQVLMNLVPGAPDEWRLAQSALAQLGERAVGEPAAAEALNRWAAMQREGQFPSRLSLDLREARRRIPGAATGAESPVDTYRDCLEGGDARRGKDVFFQQPAVQCLRCHRVGNDGGTVGPNLSDVGRRVSRAELLESILNPNARIAAGLETVVLTLKSGETVVGVVREDRADTVVVDVTDGETGQTQAMRVPVSNIEQRQRGVSAMPEGLGALLTPFELRDLVEYLAGLR
jgi:quinoprotein glucose dehydrogenase